MFVSGNEMIFMNTVSSGAVMDTYKLDSFSSSLYLFRAVLCARFSSSMNAFLVQSRIDKKVHRLKFLDLSVDVVALRHFQTEERNSISTSQNYSQMLFLLGIGRALLTEKVTNFHSNYTQTSRKFWTGDGKSNSCRKNWDLKFCNVVIDTFLRLRNYLSRKIFARWAIFGSDEF